MSGLLPVTFDDVLSARERIAGRVHRTPVLTSRTVDALTGAKVFFKAEVFQRAGAFKARGAFSRLTLLDEDERARGVVAFSSGNHAQAVALASRDLGIAATIVMPADAPELKLEATRGYGARVILYDRLGGENREAIAARLVQEEGATLVPPFDDAAVIAGQGTAALELLEEVPDLDVIVTPCGGAGLLSGCAVAGRGLRPGLVLWGVEPEAGDDVRQSFTEGRRVAIPVPKTIADSLQTTQVGVLTFEIVRALAAGILTVSDGELAEAIRLLLARMKVVVEPGGAAAAAALLSGKVPDVAARKVGIVLSGGNVDPRRLAGLLAGQK